MCTYRLKLRKGVSVVFMATLPMNVILKNELGIWNTPDISIVHGYFIRPENWLYICTMKYINWTLGKSVPSIKICYKSHVWNEIIYKINENAICVQIREHWCHENLHCPRNWPNMNWDVWKTLGKIRFI